MKEIPHININETAAGDYEFTEMDLEVARAYNQMDIQLYDFALNLFEDWWSEMIAELLEMHSDRSAEVFTGAEGMIWVVCSKTFLWHQPLHLVQNGLKRWRNSGSCYADQLKKPERC